MAEKYISAKQAYAYLRSVLYETAINNVGVKVEDFASACEEIADNRLKIWLDDIPAADVVEVVRCKDCKWAESHRLGNGGVYFRCNEIDMATLTNHYCSYGERKEKTDDKS